MTNLPASDNARPNTPLLLLILDGWGLEPDSPGNAIAPSNANTHTHTPHYQRLLETCPWLAIRASEEAVGLPVGQIGNSEVGHMTLGAGRILYQELTRIDRAIETGEFFSNPVLQQAVQHVGQTGGTLHLMGLVSNGGVHSSLNHLLALIDLAAQAKQHKLCVHAFLDGRDVPPKSAEGFLRRVEEKLLALDLPPITTLSGRYYAMDRDTRWDRVEKAYDNLVLAAGEKTPFSLHALEMAYRNDETDEFVLPRVTDLAYEGMADGDAVIFFNFRPDRARQLSRALTQPDFDAFARKKILNNLYFACLTLYDETLNLPVAFAKQSLKNLLPEIISQHGLKQYRTAETEKYAHVTFFFNGGFEPPYPGEDRKLIPSPRIATYDLQPEMSVSGVVDSICQALASKQYDFLVANLANPDMVGHTGKLSAALAAVQAVDEAIGQIVQAVEQAGGLMLLTADHGNIEHMLEPDGSEHTAHTTNPVPLLLFAAAVAAKKGLMLQKPANLTPSQDALIGLANVAPTILDLLGLPIPSEMTAQSLLCRQPTQVAV